jgi:type II secretory ATPase GspE/PulE/Tfp pilus assembly ATPase PilB-like protein
MVPAISIIDERPAFTCPHCRKEIDAIELRRFLQRQQYEERRAQGQCTRCRKKAMPGKTMCKEHLARNNKLSRKANKKANAKKKR